MPYNNHNSFVSLKRKLRRKLKRKLKQSLSQSPHNQNQHQQEQQEQEQQNILFRNIICKEQNVTLNVGSNCR